MSGRIRLQSNVQAAIAASTNYLAADPHALTAGETVIPRDLVTTSGGATTSGNLRLTYFTARKTETKNSLRMFCGSTAAAATPTLIRMGLWSVASNGDITLIGSTANDTSLFATANAVVTKAFQAGTPTVQGARYAFGLLIVTAAAAPTIAGGTGSAGSADMALDPRMSGNVTGQSDLPSTVANASIIASSTRMYAALIP